MDDCRCFSFEGESASGGIPAIQPSGLLPKWPSCTRSDIFRDYRKTMHQPAVRFSVGSCKIGRVSDQSVLRNFAVLIVLGAIPATAGDSGPIVVVRELLNAGRVRHPDMTEKLPPRMHVQFRIN